MIALAYGTSITGLQVVSEKQLLRAEDGSCMEHASLLRTNPLLYDFRAQLECYGLSCCLFLPQPLIMTGNCGKDWENNYHYY